MHEGQASGRTASFVLWIASGLRNALEPSGDYFDVLRGQIASSAPLESSCRAC